MHILCLCPVNGHCFLYTILKTFPPYIPPSFLPSLSFSLSLSPLTVGEYLQLMQAGTDLQKVRKSKTYPRIYKLDPDLLSISWNSRHKRGNRARSRFTPAGARYRDFMWQCIRRIEFRKLLELRVKECNTVSILMALINKLYFVRRPLLWLCGYWDRVCLCTLYHEANKTD